MATLGLLPPVFLWLPQISYWTFSIKGLSSLHVDGDYQWVSASTTVPL